MDWRSMIRKGNQENEKGTDYLPIPEDIKINGSGRELWLIIVIKKRHLWQLYFPLGIENLLLRMFYGHYLIYLEFDFDTV